MIKQWVAIMVFGSAWLSGCVSAGLFSQGENAVYAFWNNSDEEIEKAGTVGIYQDGKIKYLDSQSSSKPLRRYVPPGQPIHGFGGGHQMLADTGHKVPEEMEVKWRKLPAPGAKPYTGERMGPFRIKVRSRIPQQALQLARRDGYSLAIYPSAGKEPILLCWALADTGAKSDHRGLRIIMAGGQCKPEDVAWRSDIDWRKPGVWFPEPIPADQETK